MAYSILAILMSMHNAQEMMTSFNKEEECCIQTTRPKNELDSVEQVLHLDWKIKVALCL